jgi:hypothetical protein
MASRPPHQRLELEPPVAQMGNRHVTHVFDKLGAASRMQAMAHARDLGLIG